MPINILMPALSPTMEEGTLAKWLVKEGDKVSSGAVLAEIETDKATMEFEAVDEGIIGKIVVPEGTEGVKVNDLIAVLLEEGESADAIGAAPAAAPAAAAERRGPLARRQPPPPARRRPPPRREATGRAGFSPRRWPAGSPAEKGPRPRVDQGLRAERPDREGGRGDAQPGAPPQAGRCEGSRRPAGALRPPPRPMRRR